MTQSTLPDPEHWANLLYDMCVEAKWDAQLTAEGLRLVHSYHTCSQEVYQAFVDIIILAFKASGHLIPDEQSFKFMAGYYGDQGILQ